MKYQEDLDRGKLIFSQAKKFMVKNKGKGPKLDPEFHQTHEQVFQKIDCLDCANCCKTTSPIFRDVDIKRISKDLRMKEREFIDQYLRMDEDGDYVLTTAPCPFLELSTNKCEIYNIRPAACREYPHTDRKNAIQIGELHLKNLAVCPAVVKIVEKLIK